MGVFFCISGKESPTPTRSRAVAGSARFPRSTARLSSPKSGKGSKVPSESIRETERKPVPKNPYFAAGPGTLFSSSSSHTSAVESLGARQSPRGDSEPPEPTLGALGMAERLNWLVWKKR